MKIQWYPGHMTKAKRMMQEDIKLIDLVIELLDARIPLSSRNPDIDSLANNKSRLILLNKADLADERTTALWVEYFNQKGFIVVKLDSRNRGGMKQVNNAIIDACKEKIERDRRRGILNRPVRAMVCGIPNVGKSTFINSFAGKACAKTGNKPGVTKGKQSQGKTRECRAAYFRRKPLRSSGREYTAERIIYGTQNGPRAGNRAQHHQKIPQAHLEPVHCRHQGLRADQARR